jgi:hypothetical protein
LFAQNLYRTNSYIIPDNQNDININASGNIVLRPFYGPPNYGETPEIDQIESYYVLILNEPVTFTRGYVTETVQEIQLIIIDNVNIALNADNYMVNGNAFFAETGHHHTPVVIMVNMILILLDK